MRPLVWLRRKIKRGFSLLEVMVAVAILGGSLVVILSAQTGLAASNRSAANMGQAVELGRCKMTEVEEQLLKLGYQETDQIDLAVPCCLDSTPEGWTCDVKIERTELPNMNGGNALGDGGALLGASSALLGQQNAAGGPGLSLGVDAGLGDLTSQMNGMIPGAGPGGAGADGLITMVLGMLYPSLKPMYEAAIRRVTVTVHWKEGPKLRELPLVQFIVDPARGGFAMSALQGDGGAMDFSPAAAGSAGTGTAGSRTTTSTGTTTK